MQTKSFIPYARQSIEAQDIEAVATALRNDVITRGPTVEKFEAAIAAYCGVKHAVMFNSGTTALRAACHAAQVSRFDRLITTCNSFIASAAAGVLEGAQLILTDINAATGNMDLPALEQVLKQPASRGRPIIMPVHYAGIPVDMQALDALIANPDAIVIEDAAAALGSKYNDEHRVGSCQWSQMTVFSFHPAKLITTGEGGMVTTNDDTFAQRLRSYRNNGMERLPQNGFWSYQVNELTGNFNVTEFQAALGLSQLARLDALIAKRQQIIGWYQQRLADAPFIKMVTPSDPWVAAQLAVALVDFDALKRTRQQVMNALQSEGIGTQVHYMPLYAHPVFADRYPEPSESFPQMETFYSQALTLPLFDSLDEATVERICNALKGIYA